MNKFYAIGGLAVAVLVGAVVWYLSSRPEVPSPSPSLSTTATPTTASTRSVKLYYYDSQRDKDSNGNLMCSRQGLVAVTRTIPATITPIQDTVKLLLQGQLTAAERAIGITTEYPLSGLKLESASLRNGTLALAFSDPLNKTGGGSCRVAILWSQIESTVKQFPGVERVVFSPEELFQP